MVAAATTNYENVVTVGGVRQVPGGRILKPSSIKSGAGPRKQRGHNS